MPQNMHIFKNFKVKLEKIVYLVSKITSVQHFLYINYLTHFFVYIMSKIKDK